MLERLKFNNDFFVISFVLGLIYIALEWLYVSFVHTQFIYLGFKLDFNIIKFILAKALFISTIALSIYVFNKSKFIYSIFVLLILFFLIPNLVLYSFTNSIAGPVFSICGLLLATATISTRKIKIKSIQSNDSFKYTFLLGIAILFLIPILSNSGFSVNLNTLLLKDINITRETFSQNLIGFAAYAYNWEVKIILPILIVFFLIHKKYILSIISVIMLLYLYVISGNKIVYMTTIVMIFFYYLSFDYIHKIRNFVIICFISLISFYLFDLLLDGYLLRGTFVMRLFFIPALLNNHYFDFFHGNPFYFAETHILNQFFHSPFSDKIGFVISKVYFGVTDMYASNGIISDGYMNLGYLGVTLFVAVFSVIFLFFNSFNLDSSYFGIFFVFIFLFLSAPMFTIIITGGLWFLIICAFFILSRKVHLNSQKL
ncbi:MAG: O-antigen polymerase [Bacteroidota bacterium]